mgnify:CR=1 FL=1
MRRSLHSFRSSLCMRMLYMRMLCIAEDCVQCLCVPFLKHEHFLCFIILFSFSSLFFFSLNNDNNVKFIARARAVARNRTPPSRPQRRAPRASRAPHNFPALSSSSPSSSLPSLIPWSAVRACQRRRVISCVCVYPTVPALLASPCSGGRTPRAATHRAASRCNRHPAPQPCFHPHTLL